jgi:hypothetical protein
VDEATYLAIFNHPPAGLAASGSMRSHGHLHNHHHHHHHRPGAQSPSHNSDGLSSGQSFASSSPATSPVCSTDSSPPSSASSSSSLSYRHTHKRYHSVTAGGHSAANSIDWNQFLASSSLVAFEQQLGQPPAAAGSAGKRNNLVEKWPSSFSNYSRQQQQQHVYLMNGHGSPFNAACDLADQAKALAQPINCDSATIFMQQQSAGPLAKRQQQLDNHSNKYHRNNRTKTSSISIESPPPAGRRKKQPNNQKNHNQMAASLQFSMQLTTASNGQTPLSPGYETAGAIYQTYGQARQKQRSNNDDQQQRLADQANNNSRKRQLAFDHSYHSAVASREEDGHHQQLISQQLDGNTRPAPRRGRRPGARRAVAALTAALAPASYNRHKQTAAGRGGGRQHNDNDTHLNPNHQQIFHAKHHRGDGSKSLGSKTITRTSAPMTTHAQLAGNSNSPTANGAAVPLIKAAEPSGHDSSHAHQLNRGRTPSSSSSLAASQRRRLSSGSSSASSAGPQRPAVSGGGSHRRVRGENRKCRKVYGMERRDQWCTQCKWKKACTRFSADGKALLLANNYDS